MNRDDRDQDREGDHDPPPLDADLAAWADHLRSLRPSPLDPDRRDAILLAAARASAVGPRAPGRFWPALAASLALIALGEGLLLARRPAPAVVERVVIVREPTPVPVPAAPTPPEAAPRWASDPPRPDRPSAPPPSASRSRLDLADRSDARPTDEVAPRLPALSGADLRREVFRQVLGSPGGPS